MCVLERWELRNQGRWAISGTIDLYHLLIDYLLIIFPEECEDHLTFHAFEIELYMWGKK